MPTENPKISLYVPQTIYDRFKEFQEERGLSMSQAGIVILAEYFGLEETIKEITEGTTVGGVTLQRIELIENKLNELTQVVERLTTTNINKSSASVTKLEETSPPNKNNLSELPAKPQVDQKISSPLLFLSSDSPNTIFPITGHLLAKRLNVAKDTPSGYRKKNPAKFYEWTKEKDFDQIGWRFSQDEKGYLPVDELPSELLNRLINWIQKNS